MPAKKAAPATPAAAPAKPTSHSARRPASTPVSTREAGRRKGVAYSWPPPKDSIADKRRWPAAREFNASSDQHLAALLWLQDVAMAVRDERFQKRWSLERLAKEAGVSYNAVKDLEGGLRWPSVQTLMSCCHALDLELSIERSGLRSGQSGP